MELEFSIAGCETEEYYPVILTSPTASEQNPPPCTLDGVLQLDWLRLIEAILADLAQGRTPGQISAQFHNAMVEGMILVAQRVGIGSVVLSGGCFQNRYLTERSIQRLQEEGFHPYWHQRVPPNDGGICLGQVMSALRGRQWSISG